MSKQFSKQKINKKKCNNEFKLYLKIEWILFSEKLYQYSCQWNYRPDHCMYMSNCRAAEKEGISVIHGNRGVYHNDKQPIFKAVYQAIRQVVNNIFTLR